MQQELIDKIKSNPKFDQLVSQRRRLSWTLTFIMLAVYYGFIMLLAFSPGLFETHIGGGTTTIGFPIGVGIILIAFILTGIYVRKANKVYDRLTREIEEEVK